MWHTEITIAVIKHTWPNGNILKFQHGGVKVKVIKNCIHCGLGEEFTGNLNPLMECDDCKPNEDSRNEDDADFTILGLRPMQEDGNIIGMYSHFKRKD